MEFNGQYRLSDLQAAHRLHAQRGWVSRVVEYLLVGTAALVMLLGAASALLGSGDWTLVIYPAMFLAAWAIFQFIWVPRQVARTFAQRKDYSAPFTVKLNDNHFEFQSEYGNSRVPWKEFVKWIENKELLLLYRSDQAYHMLPKRIFGERGGIDYARERLRDHKVPVAGKVQNPVEAAIVLTLVIVMIIVFLVQIAAG